MNIEKLWRLRRGKIVKFGNSPILPDWGRNDTQKQEDGKKRGAGGGAVGLKMGVIPPLWRAQPIAHNHNGLP
jgi:hypothetical protein